MATAHALTAEARQDLPTVTVVDGAPTAVADVLSPRDTYGDVHQRIAEYLGSGVRLVWVLSPRDRTVTVYRPDARPQLLNEDQELTGDPHLPGFRVPVARLFG